MENKISITIPPADLTAIKDATKVLQTKLGPLLIALNAQQRKDRNKMGEASKPFVEKVLEFAVSNPEFLPALQVSLRCKRIGKPIPNWVRFSTS